MIITVDGFTASGKSTTVRKVANELHFFYLYTGLLYRGLAYLLMKKESYTLDLLPQASQEHIDYYLNSSHFSYQYDGKKEENIIYNNQVITNDLRTPSSAKAASLLAFNNNARKKIEEYEHYLARQHKHIIVDSRNAGSVVFPQASCKFFFTAAQETRAQRWYKDQQEKGITLSYKDALNDIIFRDKRDILSFDYQEKIKNEKSSHNKPFIIDTTHFSIQEITEKLLSIIRPLL